MRYFKASMFPAAGFLLFASLAISQSLQMKQTGTWTRLGPFGGPIQSLAQNPANHDMLYAMTDLYPNTLYRSENHGSDWTERYRFENYGIYCFAMDPSNPDVLYAGTYYNIFKSVNGGEYWERKSANNYYFYGLLVDPKDPKRIHGYGYFNDNSQTRRSYLVSTDRGNSWNHTVFSDDQITYIYDMAVDPLHPDTLYICGYYYNETLRNNECRLFRSMDGGDTWSMVGTGIVGLYLLDIVIDPVETNKIYGITHSGVFRSSDWGSTFLASQDWAYGNKLVMDPNNRNVLYAGYNEVVFKSTNGGVNWKYTNQGLTFGSCSDILVDRASSDVVFLSGSSGVFQSIDGATTWNPSHQGIYATRIPSLKVSPFSSDVLFINVYGDAVYKTTNAMGKALAGQTISWERLPEFYACDDVSDFEFDPLDPNILYAFEGGS